MSWAGYVLSASESLDYHQVPGVYALVHLPTGLRYIGQTRCLHQRRAHHFSSLRLGKHQSKRIRALAAEGGSDAFVFVILAVSRESGLDDAERSAVEQAGEACVNTSTKGPGRGEWRYLIEEGREIRERRVSKGLSLSVVASYARLPMHAVALIEYGVGISWATPRERVKRAVDELQPSLTW